MQHLGRVGVAAHERNRGGAEEKSLFPQFPPVKFRALPLSTNIDRLNIGPIPTTKLDWLQPHEGNICGFSNSAQGISNSTTEACGQALNRPFRLKRLPSDSQDAEADDFALGIHALHDGIMAGLFHALWLKK